MSKAKTRTAVLAAWVVIVLALGLGPGEARPQGLERIALSYPSVTSTGGLVPWIAKERGLFTANGLSAELIYTSGALSMQALIAGSVDLVLGSIFDPLAAIAGGADIVVLGSFNNSPPYVMAARPDVREITQLKGRKVGVRSLTGPATAMTQMVLEGAGLNPKRDVQILRVGGTAVRLAALKDGHIDAALIDEALEHRAKESGLNIIRLRGVPHIHTGIYARRSGVQQREAAIVAGLRALRAAAIYLKSTKSGTIEVIKKMMKVNDAKAAERSYEILSEHVETDPRIPAAVIQQSINLAAQSEPRVNNIDVNRAFDMTLVTKSMVSGSDRK